MKVKESCCSSLSMEGKEEEGKLCRHCKKEVALVNFALHESHCSRFLCRCPDCDESVPRDTLEQHRDEQHTQVRCGLCKRKMERCHLEEHAAQECEQRQQSCQFCELEMPHEHLAGHEKACGSRTERCPDCGRYVQLRERDAHEMKCSPPPKGHKLTQELCFTCMKSFPSDQIRHHKITCTPPVPKRNSLTTHHGEMNWQPLRGKQDLCDADEIGTCPRCSLTLPLETLQWHKVKCHRLDVQWKPVWK